MWEKAYSHNLLLSTVRLSFAQVIGRENFYHGSSTQSLTRYSSYEWTGLYDFLLNEVYCPRVYSNFDLFHGYIRLQYRFAIRFYHREMLFLREEQNFASDTFGLLAPYFAPYCGKHWDILVCEEI